MFPNCCMLSFVGIRHSIRHDIRHGIRHSIRHSIRHMIRHMIRHADGGAGMVFEDDGTGLGETLQDAGERLAMHAEFAGDGIGAATDRSFVVGDEAKVVKHLPVAL